MTEPTRDEIQTAFGDAIANAVTTLEQGFLSRWVVVAESTDQEGRRGVWVAENADAATWDTLGLLHHALLQYTLPA